MTVEKEFMRHLCVISDKDIYIYLIKDKSKPILIPRLQLQAAAMGCRLGNFLNNEFVIKIDDIFYWTDFTTVKKM